MNYPFIPIDGHKPTPVPASAKKKKKSPIPSLREWQNINFEHMALTTLKNRNRHPDVIAKLQEKVDALDEQRRPQRRANNPFIIHGCQSVLFFLKNPQYIPLMKQEILARQVARKAAKEKGDDILDQDLDNSVLADHCQEHSNLIFSKGNTSEGDNTWSVHYLHVRNSFIEAMGRAARAAEYALRLEKSFEDQRSASITDALRFSSEGSKKKPVPPTPPVNPDIPSPAAENHWNEPRPSEEQVNELLNNHCDDNVPGMEDISVPANPSAPTTIEPIKISSKKTVYVQTDFLHILEHQ